MPPGRVPLSARVPLKTPELHARDSKAKSHLTIIHSVRDVCPRRLKQGIFALTLTGLPCLDTSMSSAGCRHQAGAAHSELWQVHLQALTAWFLAGGAWSGSDLCPPPLQVLTSANWGADIGNFFTGGLNLQVEHHLFPAISFMHYPAISRIVADECAKRGIPYVHYDTLPEIIGRFNK